MKEDSTPQKDSKEKSFIRVYKEIEPFLSKLRDTEKDRMTTVRLMALHINYLVFLVVAQYFLFTEFHELIIEDGCLSRVQGFLHLPVIASFVFTGIGGWYIARLYGKGGISKKDHKEIYLKEIKKKSDEMEKYDDMDKDKQFISKSLDKIIDVVYHNAKKNNTIHTDLYNSRKSFVWALLFLAVYLIIFVSYYL